MATDGSTQPERIGFATADYAPVALIRPTVWRSVMF
jgi:hypothetical protein